MSTIKLDQNKLLRTLGVEATTKQGDSGLSRDVMKVAEVKPYLGNFVASGWGAVVTGSETYRTCVRIPNGAALRDVEMYVGRDYVSGSRNSTIILWWLEPWTQARQDAIVTAAPFQEIGGPNRSVCGIFYDKATNAVFPPAGVPQWGWAIDLEGAASKRATIPLIRGDLFPGSDCMLAGKFLAGPGALNEETQHGNYNWTEV